MKHFVILAIGALLLIVCGCDTVSVDAPVGLPVPIDQKMALAGRWASEKGDAFEIRLGDDEALYWGQTRWDGDQKQFIARTTKLDVRLVGASLFIFGEDNGKYGFVRLSFSTPDSLLISPPDATAFRDAIKQDRLSGEVVVDTNDHFHVRLSSEDEKLLSIFAATGDTPFFPQIFAQNMTILKRFAAAPKSGE